MEVSMTLTKTILVVGSLNMDLVVSAERLPEKGETIFGKTFAAFPGGKGANQAAAAGKLGAATVMVGCVGQDSFAQELLASLQNAKVSGKFVRQVDISTGTALITVDSHGFNTIVVVAGANVACDPLDVDKALAAINEPGVLLVQNEIPQKTVEYTITAAKQHGWTVVLNPAPVRALDISLMPMIDIIIPNETEMALLTKRDINTPDAAAAAAEQLIEWGIGAVVVTMGSKGAICRTPTGNHYIPPYVVTAVDTTAAGDAYAGGLATGLAEGKTLLESMKFAAAVAALSVTRAGAQPSLPWRLEVDEFIKKQGDLG
jgi:ribokinase